MSAPSSTDLSSYPMDVHRTYCNCTNQDWQTLQHPHSNPKKTGSPHRLKRGGNWQAKDVIYKCTQYSQGVMVYAQRSAGWFSLLLPSHITTCHWPLHAMPPQYLWLSSMHRLNPLTQELLLASCVLWENEKYSNHILYVQTTDSVPRNLQIWVLSGVLLLLFGFFRLYSDWSPTPHFLHYGVLVFFFFCGVSYWNGGVPERC